MIQEPKLVAEQKIAVLYWKEFVVFLPLESTENVVISGAVLGVSIPISWHALKWIDFPRLLKLQNRVFWCYHHLIHPNIMMTSNKILKWKLCYFRVYCITEKDANSLYHKVFGDCYIETKRKWHQDVGLVSFVVLGSLIVVGKRKLSPKMSNNRALTT